MSRVLTFTPATCWALAPVAEPAYSTVASTSAERQRRRRRAPALELPASRTPPDPETTPAWTANTDQQHPRTRQRDGGPPSPYQGVRVVTTPASARKVRLWTEAALGACGDTSWRHYARPANAERAPRTQAIGPNASARVPVLPGTYCGGAAGRHPPPL